jgi:class 3 adenylate cyclase
MTSVGPDVVPAYTRSMQTCASCGAANPDGARFCVSCGSSLVPGCRQCGAELPEGARFCPSCGAPIEASEPPPAGTERKLVTILFADLEGSTGLGERLDPERLGELLESYFSAMREQIEAEGGTVEKFIGDAVMAAFGVPTAHEDDPARALRAALRMRQRLDSMNGEIERRYGVRLRLRTGVNTGEVLAAVRPQPGEAMVTGDAVNTAARLEQLAEPGDIVVAERTARAARAFSFRPLGDVRLRGKETGVAAVVLDEDEPVRPERGLPGLTAPMVGRDRELALLRTVYERAVAEERPALVTVYGDPGVGKSRLTREFVAVAEHADAPPTVVAGRCLPYGDGVTYWPLAEILKSLADVRDSDPPDVTLERLRSFGAERLRAVLDDDTTRATAALAYTVGVEDPDHPFSSIEPREVRSRIHAAWRSLFTSLALTGPVVAIVEDIHWADPALLDLLEELADRVAGAVVFVCPARPELVESRPAWGGGRRNRSSIALEPLHPDEAERLIGFLLSVDDLPDTVRARILERAEGNPFFLEEIVRHLIDDGRIVHDGGSWRATSDVADVEIPDTVQGVLAARIDLLDPAAKRTLQRAAVVGRVFWPGPVGRLLNGDAGALGQTLEHLEERELVLSRVGSAIAGEPEFLFKHILTREVAYETLPRRERGPAHAAVAAWLEETAGARAREFVELLAYHWEEAYRGELEHRSDPGRLAELRGRALDALLSASEDARRRFAVHHASSLAERALAVADDDAQRARALEQIGSVALNDYQGDRAWESFTRAVDLRLRATPDDRIRIAGTCARAVEAPLRWPGSMRLIVDEDEVTRYIEIGFEHVPEGDSEERARLLMSRAFRPFAAWTRRIVSEEELRESESAGLAASDMAIRLGRPDLASAALDGAVTAPGNRADYGRMRAINQRRMTLVDQLDDPFELGDIYSMSAWCDAYIGNLAQARAHAERGVVVAADSPTVVGCLSWLTFTEFCLGEWDRVVDHLQPAIESRLGDRADNPPHFTIPAFGATAVVLEARAAPSAERYVGLLRASVGTTQGYSAGMADAWFARILAHRGRVDEALSVLDGIAPALRLAVSRPFIDSVAASVLGAAGAWDRAETFVEETRAYAADAKLVALPAHVDRLEGLLARSAGDLERGRGRLQRSAEAFTAIGDRWNAALAELDLATTLADEGRNKDATHRCAAAEATFERLRSIRDLERARSLGARLSNQEG